MIVTFRGLIKSLPIVSLSFYISFSIFLTMGSSKLFAVDYDIRNDWIVMSDGVRLSVTYYLPQSGDTTAPVLLEMLPYRKEDLSKAWAHPLYDYFARQGIALAKVDIRGTGGSEGQTPGREYSPQEIDDAVEVIAALAKQPWSNGNVGMWGISWGGFNSIQVALRNPPQLKAILAAHASHDLYSNDVHYTDGIFSIDEYILSINHMTGFMQSPEYEISEQYFSNRFDREPWLFETLRHDKDSEFWRAGSLRWQYDKLNIPVYLIGGLLDGYRDTLPHVLENASVPVRAVLGPWPHAWPESATPGPSWEWRKDASRWWKHWLQDNPAQHPEFDTNSFRFFLRTGDKADAELDELRGQWFASQWPLTDEQSELRSYYPGLNNRLQPTLVTESPSFLSLDKVASSGVALGEWWGELLPDMSAIDADALVFDSVPFTSHIPILGEAKVSLLAASDASDGYWIVRLEDVHPDGSVALITGGAINGQMRKSRRQPDPLQPDTFYELSIPLRMTSWTFQPGHKLRLAISNAAFPMFWPSAKLRSSQLKIDTPETRLQLPVWNSNDQSPLSLAAGESSNYLPGDEITMAPVSGNPRVQEVVNNEDGSVSFVRSSGLAYKLPALTLQTTRSTTHTVNDDNPAQSQFQGWAEYQLVRDEISAATVRYRTEISLTSDETHFHLDVSRILWSDDNELRRKNWQESIPRNAR